MSRPAADQLVLLVSRLDAVIARLSPAARLDLPGAVSDARKVAEPVAIFPVHAETDARGVVTALNFDALSITSAAHELPHTVQNVTSHLALPDGVSNGGYQAVPLPQTAVPNQSKSVGAPQPPVQLSAATQAAVRGHVGSRSQSAIPYAVATAASSFNRRFSSETVREVVIPLPASRGGLGSGSDGGTGILTLHVHVEGGGERLEDSSEGREGEAPEVVEHECIGVEEQEGGETGVQVKVEVEEDGGRRRSLAPVLPLQRHTHSQGGVRGPARADHSVRVPDIEREKEREGAMQLERQERARKAEIAQEAQQAREAEEAREASEVRSLSSALRSRDELFAVRDRSCRLQAAWGAWRVMVAADRPAVGSSAVHTRPIAAWAALRLVRLCWSLERVGRQPVFAVRDRAIFERSLVHLTRVGRLHAGLPASGVGAGAGGASTPRSARGRSSLSASVAGSVSSSSAPPGVGGGHVSPSKSVTRPTGGHPRRDSLVQALSDWDVSLRTSAMQGSTPGSTPLVHRPAPSPPNRGRSASVSVNSGGGGGAYFRSSSIGAQRRGSSSSVLYHPPSKSDMSWMTDLDWEAEKTGVATAAVHGVSLPLHRPSLWHRTEECADPARLRMCFHGWIGWIRALKRVRTKHERKACARVFGPWLQWTLRRAALNRKGAAVTLAVRKRMVRRCLASWGEGYKKGLRGDTLLLRIEGLQSCLQGMVAVACRRMVRAWKEEVVRLRSLRHAVACMSKRTLGVAFRSFVHAIRRSQSQSAVMRKACLTLSNKSLVHAVWRWRETVGERMRLRGVALAIARRITNSRTHACISQWRVRATYAVAKKKTLLPILARMRNKVLHAAFQSVRGHAAGRLQWRAHCLARSVVLRAHQLQRFVREWRASASANRRATSCLAKAAAFLRHRSFAPAFNAWKAYSTERRRVRVASLRVVKAFMHGRLFSAVSAWREETASRREAMARLTKAVSFLQSRTARAAFNAWRDLCSSSKTLRETAGSVALALQRGRLYSSVQYWRSNARGRRQYAEGVGKALALLHSREARAAFNAWRDLCLGKRELRGRVESVARAFSNARMFSAMARWRENAFARRETRDAVRRAMSVWTASTSSRSFGAMREYAAVRCEWRVQVATAMSSMQGRAKAMAVRAWGAWARRHAMVRSLLTDNAADRKAATASGVFGAWKTWAVRRRTVHAACDKAVGVRRARLAKGAVTDWHFWARSTRIVRFALRRLQFGVRSTVFDGWRVWAVHASEIRHAKERFAIWVRTARLHSALAQWCRDASITAGTRRLALSRSQSALRPSLATWRGCTAVAVRDKSTMVQARAALVNRALRIALHSWQSRMQLHRAYVALYGQHRDTVLTRAFAGWARAVVVQSRLRGAGYTLAARQTTRGMASAVAAWRVWAGACRRRRLALHGALRHWRHGAVARCFDVLRTQARERRVWRVMGEAARHAIDTRRLKAAMKHWRFECGSQCPAGAKAVPAFSERWFDNRVRAHVRAWKSHAKHSAAVRRAFETTFDTHNTGSLRSSWSTWAAYARIKSARKRMCARAAKRLQALKAGRAVAAWTAHAAHVQRVRMLQGVIVPRVSAVVSRVCLEKCLRGWMEACAGQRAATAYSIMVTRKACTTVWRAWAAYAGERKARRALVGRSVAHLLEFKTWSGVTRWRGRAAQSRANRDAESIVSDRVDRRKAGEAFGAWVRWALVRQRLAACVRMLRAQRLETCLVRGLHRWRARAHMAVQTRHARDSHATTTSARYFGAWRRAASFARQERISRIASARTHADTRRLYAAWEHLRLAGVMHHARKLAIRTVTIRAVMRVWRAAATAASEGERSPSQVRTF